MSGAIDLPGVAPKQDPSGPLDAVAAGQAPGITTAAQGTDGGQPAAAIEGITTAQTTTAARLRAAYNRALGRSVEEFPVPGWNGELIARVHVLEDREEYVNAARAEDADAAFIARATTQLIMRNSDGALEELADERGAIAFDVRFAALIGVTAESASECVYLAFARNPAAISRFAERLVGWMQREEQQAGAQLPS